MVGIFYRGNGLHFEAISQTEETAIQALFDKYATDSEKKGITPREWWERGRKNYDGAPWCYEIKPVQEV